MPIWFGGNGDTKNLFTDFPFKNKHPGLLLYGLVQLGYYLFDLYEHNFVRPKTGDYQEMNLHHVLTISLIGGMLLMNIVVFGCFISFLHNFSDILMIMTRLLSNTIYKKSTFACFISGIILWIITRNIMLPIITYQSWQDHVFRSAQLSKYQGVLYVMNLFLSLICLMHVYWTSKFFTIIINAIKDGNNDDPHRKLVVERKKTN